MTFELPAHTNEQERENALLHPDQATVRVMTDDMEERFAKGEAWEAGIMAAEMALVGAPPELQEEQIVALQRLLEELRTEPSGEADIDLARWLYRFHALGIDAPSLTAEERQRLQALPARIRSGEEYPETHLLYLPQIAEALGEPLETIKNAADGERMRTELETGAAEEERLILGGGLLAELDEEEARKFAQRWDENAWGGHVRYVLQQKGRKDGWALARLLPHIQRLLRLKKGG